MKDEPDPRKPHSSSFLPHPSSLPKPDGSGRPASVESSARVEIRYLPRERRHGHGGNAIGGPGAGGARPRGAHHQLVRPERGPRRRREEGRQEGGEEPAARG